MQVGREERTYTVNATQNLYARYVESNVPVEKIASPSVNKIVGTKKSAAHVTPSPTQTPSAHASSLDYQAQTVGLAPEDDRSDHEREDDPRCDEQGRDGREGDERTAGRDEMSRNDEGSAWASREADELGWGGRTRTRGRG